MLLFILQIKSDQLLLITDRLPKIYKHKPNLYLYSVSFFFEKLFYNL